MDLDVHERKILSTVARLKIGEKERASDAGEAREQIGSLLELTGLNKKAFSFVRSLDKMEQDKRADVLRSLDPLREMFERHWSGQNTPDMLDALVEPEAPREEEPDDTAEDEDEAAFEAHMQELGTGRVVPFGEVA